MAAEQPGINLPQTIFHHVCKYNTVYSGEGQPVLRVSQPLFVRRTTDDVSICR